MKKGAQDERHIIPCDAEIFRSFQRAADGLVKFIGIAPEEGDAKSFIQAVKGEAAVSLAHTNADYDTCLLYTSNIFLHLLRMVQDHMAGRYYHILSVQEKMAFSGSNI